MRPGTEDGYGQSCEAIDENSGGWDDDAEAELISLYLGVDENQVTITRTPAEFRAAIESDAPFDIVLMTIELPDSDAGFKLFELLREHYPDSPVVGACPPAEVFHVVRFMANGMSAYVTRDTAGDYMFMLRAILKSTLEAVRAAREKELVKKLREEVESVRKLQETVIPKNLKAPSGYRLCGRYEPSQIRVLGGKAVTLAGGDYYDVISLADGNIALLVADAAGHGMKSCLSIMTLHTDGLEEAFHEGNDEDQFGVEGIVRTMSETIELPVEESLARLFDASNEYTQGSGRKDDTSSCFWNIEAETDRGRSMHP